MDPLLLSVLLATCAPQVHPTTARALIAVESNGNPHAIGVVGGALRRQPANRGEALATARALHAAGWGFSVGLGQINQRNFARLGLTIDSAFEPCTNLAAMQTVLTECFERAAHRQPQAAAALRASLSCYYSGNFHTGLRHGYVRKVARASAAIPATPTSKEES